MDNILAPLSFGITADANRFIKKNVCGICLGELTIGLYVTRHNQAGYEIKCWPCLTLCTVTNTVSRHKADKVKSDRHFAAREIREKKPLTKAGMAKALKDLGF